jgi:TrmH family RNA methyltransferase
VVITGDADVHDPACARAAMGALEALDLARASPSELVCIVRRSGGGLVGASPDAVVDFRRARYRRPTVVVVGEERGGLSETMRRACDDLVRIPMVGRVDSLNLAVAGSLVVYEVSMARRG